MLTDVALEQKWIAALRGGAFEQGKGFLRDVYENYCCLGVLCEASGKGVWNEAVSVHGDRTYQYYYKGNLQYNVVPEELREEIGLSLEDQQILYTMNDVEGCTFEQIADYVASRESVPCEPEVNK